MENKKIINKRIPTMLGVMVLIGGLIAGIVLIGKPQSLESLAGPTSLPKNIKTTNKGPDLVTVSWTTDIPVTGLVKYSDNPTDLKLPAGDIRDQASGTSTANTTHYVDIGNLTADKTYYFEIVSGSQSYQENTRSGSKPYQVRTTTASSVGAEDVITGKVVTTESKGLVGAIVYVDIEGGETLSALTKTNGDWRLDLAKARDKTGKVLSYDKVKQNLSIFVQGGTAGTAMALTNTSKDTPVPMIMMGKTSNFIDDEGTAKILSGVGAGTGGEAGSFGTLAGQASQVVAETEELLNPIAEGERIATSSPEFRGKLPVGTEVKITVNSLLEQVETVVTDEDGEWSWTPPEELEAGEHTVEIEYTDAGGILQTITRSFTVLAAGDEESLGLPSLVATPSATVTPATESGSTMPATQSGVDEPGVVSSTIWLLVVGAGMFTAGRWGKRRFSYQREK